MLMLVVGIVTCVCLVSGFNLLETGLVLLSGIFSLGFLAWVIQGFKPNLLRCIFFWWIARLLDKPHLLDPPH